MQPTLLFGVKSNRVGGRDWNLPLRRRQAGSHTRRDGRLRQGKDELIPPKVGLVKGQGLVFSTNGQARFFFSWNVSFLAIGRKKSLKIQPG